MTTIIKRYRNRKLYNTTSKRYVTLNEIVDLIKKQEDVKVVDNSTGEDLTATTLSQIIFEQEKNQAGFLPSAVLLSLVQSGGHRIDEIRQNIFKSLNLSHHYDVEIERRINWLIENGEIDQELGVQLLGKLLRVISPADETIKNLDDRIIDFLKQRQIPTKKEMHDLIQKIDELSKRVEEINDKKL